MNKFDININNELEGFNVIEINGIQTEEGIENSVIATFYDHEKAVYYVNLLNNLSSN